MHKTVSYSQFSPDTYVILNPFIKDKDKASLSPTKKLEHSLKLNISSPKKDFSFEILRESTQINQVSFEDLESQAKHCLSLIKDPLWKSVCAEMADLMGFSYIQRMWDSKLGTFCFKDKSINLCCPTEETAQFINQYSFLVLGSLQRYFPTVRTLKTKVGHAN